MSESWITALMFPVVGLINFVFGWLACRKFGMSDPPITVQDNEYDRHAKQVTYYDENGWEYKGQVYLHSEDRP